MVTSTLNVLRKVRSQKLWVPESCHDSWVESRIWIKNFNNLYQSSMSNYWDSQLLMIHDTCKFNCKHLLSLRAPSPVASSFRHRQRYSLSSNDTPEITRSINQSWIQKLLASILKWSRKKILLLGTHICWRTDCNTCKRKLKYSSTNKSHQPIQTTSACPLWWWPESCQCCRSTIL